MRRTHVPAYRLLRSLSNKYIIFSSHYRTPCIIGTCLSPPKTSPEVIFLPKNLFQGKGVGIFIYQFVTLRVELAWLRNLGAPGSPGQTLRHLVQLNTLGLLVSPQGSQVRIPLNQYPPFLVKSKTETSIQFSSNYLLHLVAGLLQDLTREFPEDLTCMVLPLWCDP